MQKKSKIMTKLNAEYETLSEIQSQFGRNSRHKVAQYIDKRMSEVLKLIENLKIALTVRKADIKKMTRIGEAVRSNGMNYHYYHIELSNGDEGAVRLSSAVDILEVVEGSTILYTVTPEPLSEINLVQAHEIEI